MLESLGIEKEWSIDIQDVNYSILKINRKEISDELLLQYADLKTEILNTYNRPIPIPTPEYQFLRMRSLQDVEVRREYYFLVRENELISYIFLHYNTGSHNRDRIYLEVGLKDLYKGQNIDIDFSREIIKMIPERIKIMEFEQRVGDEDNNEFLKILINNGAKKVIQNRNSASEIQLFKYRNVHYESQYLLREANRRGYDFFLVEDANFENDPRFNYFDFLNLVERIWNTVPREDGTWDDEEVTSEFHKSLYSCRKVLKQKIFTIIALEKSTKLPIGYTETIISEYNPHVAEQWDTGVISEHHGKSLGLTLKYLMLDRLISDPRTSNIRYWKTSNASTDVHILRINKLLGYKEYWISCGYEVTKDRVYSILNI